MNTTTEQTTEQSQSTNPLGESNVRFNDGEGPQAGRPGVFLLRAKGPRGYVKTSNFVGTVVVGGKGVFGDGDCRFVYVQLRRNPNEHGASHYELDGSQLPELVTQIEELMQGMPSEDIDDDYDLQGNNPLIYGPTRDLGPYGKVANMNMPPRDGDLFIACENTFFGLCNLQIQLERLNGLNPVVSPFRDRVYPDRKVVANKLMGHMANQHGLLGFVIQEDHCIFLKEDLLLIDHEVQGQDGDYCLVDHFQGMFICQFGYEHNDSYRHFIKGVVTTRIRTVETIDGFTLDIKNFSGTSGEQAVLEEAPANVIEGTPSNDQVDELATFKSTLSEAAMHELEKAAQDVGLPRRLALLALARSAEELSSACKDSPNAFGEMRESVEWFAEHAKGLATLGQAAAARVAFCDLRGIDGRMHG